MDWIFSRRPGGGDGPTFNNSNNSIIPTNNSGVVKPKDVPDNEIIELVNKSRKEDIKKLFSSPSLENLNEQAKDSWNSIGSPPTSEGSLTPTASSSKIVSGDIKTETKEVWGTPEILTKTVDSSKIKIDTPFPLKESSFNPNIDSKTKVDTLMEKVSELKNNEFGDINEDNF